MNYDHVLEHVGQFGLWQIVVCLLASLAAMAEAFMNFQFTFIGYSNFKYLRCSVDLCDTNGTSFSASHVSFSIPPSNGSTEEEHACLMYKTIDPNGKCSPNNFDTNVTVACKEHIYSDQVPYQLSLSEELDLPPCTTDEDWPLNVSA